MAAQSSVVGGLAVEERPLKHAEPLESATSVRSDLALRAQGLSAFNGRCHRLAVRPGFDLTVYDMSIDQPFAGSGHTEPGLVLTVMLDGAGKGRLTMPSPQVSPLAIPYAPGITYLAFGQVPMTGSYALPAGSCFRVVELRFTLAFLARIDVLGLFQTADGRHRLHCVSAPGIWIGTLHTPRAVADAATTILQATLDVTSTDLAIEARALNILNDVIDLMRGAAPERLFVPRRADRDKRRLRQARDLLLSDLAYPWTIRELAQRVGINERKLKEGFRALFGEPVHGFLLKSRLRAARSMLERNDMSITDVSMTIGYANPSHFAHLFRREFGINPSGYLARAVPSEAPRASRYGTG